MILPVSEHDRAFVQELAGTILEIDCADRVALALERADVREIPLAGKVGIVTLLRDDAEALLRAFFDFRTYGKAGATEHRALERLVPPLYAAVRG
ncbi:MAG TPA: hypothetical protein VFJ24_10270 [Gaiellales bacterium]|nr:hypothetical protein [Gaiellales bacterium]